MKVPLRTTFVMSHKLWTAVCSFSFVSRYFLIFSLILLLAYSFFNSMISNLHEFECFWVFPWGWFLVSVPGGQRQCLIWFQFSWICWDLFCVLSCGLSLKMFHMLLKRMYILLLWGVILWRHQLNQFYLLCQIKPPSCWFFCLTELSTEVNGVLKSPYWL